MTSKITIIDNNDRSKLVEGRNYQMGYAFLKRTNKSTYNAISALSACKDYLNDVVFTQITQKPIVAYGFKTSYLKTLYKKDHAYLGIKILPMFGSNTNKDFNISVDKANLVRTYPYIQTLLNHVETLFNVEGRTIIHPANDDFYLVIVPIFWTRYTYLISLYALLIRMGQFWDGQGTAEDYLKNYNNSLDKNLWNSSKLKFEELLKTGLVHITYEKIPAEIADGYHTNIHNAGISNYKSYLETFIKEPI